MSQEENEDSDESGGSSDGWGLLQRACRYFESGSFQGELGDFRRCSSLVELFAVKL